MTKKAQLTAHTTPGTTPNPIDTPHQPHSATSSEEDPTFSQAFHEQYPEDPGGWTIGEAPTQLVELT